MKRITSLVLAVLMIAMLAFTCVSVSAANTPLDTAQKVSFTLNCNKKGYEFTVYRVADLRETTSPYEFKYNSRIANISDSVFEGKSQDIINDLDKLAEDVISVYAIGTFDTSSAATKAFTNVDQGIYYVRATNYPAEVLRLRNAGDNVGYTTPGVGNSVFALPYYDATAGWTYGIPAINLAEKVREFTPEIHKEITNSTKNNVNFTDVSLGDTVNFQIDTDIFGNVDAEYTARDFKFNTYIITDDMSKGLTFVPTSVKVQLLKENGSVQQTVAATDYEVKATGGNGSDTQIVLGIKKSMLDTANFYTAAKVRFTYSATLNEHAVIGKAGNPNTATELMWSNKNNVTGTVEGNTVYVYTYGEMIYKTDDKSAALGGAKFELYATEADADAYRNPIATGTSNTSGIVKFYKDGVEMKLASGKYYAKETEAPDGYNRYTKTIVLDSTASTTYNETFNETNKTWVKTEPSFRNNAGYTGADVANSKIILPQTGGIGSTAFIIGGIVLLLAAGVVLIIGLKKKKNASK